MLSCDEARRTDVKTKAGDVRLSNMIRSLSPLLAIMAVSSAAAQGPLVDGRWRLIATDQDRARLRGWRAAWTEGLAAAGPRATDAIAAEGPLLDPDAALLDPAPPPGAYRCRTIRLGGRSGAPDWTVEPTGPCRVRQAPDGSLRFTRLAGSQRPSGRLYPAGTRRLVFLGSQALGDERRSLRYTADPQRDLAGVVERVGPRRWRLVFPRPTFQSIIDVVELVPAS